MAGAEDAERYVAVLARDGHRLLDLGDVARAEGEPGCPAAQVARAVAGVRPVAGLDGPLGQRRREVVVRDPGVALRQGRRATDLRALLRAAGAAGLGDPLAHLGEELGEAAQAALVVAHDDEGADAVLGREAHQVVGAGLAADVEQPGDLGRVAAGDAGRLVEAAVDGLSARLLTARLRELEAHDIVEREVIPTTPVQVRYRLTPRGRDLLAAMQPLMAYQMRWGH